MISSILVGVTTFIISTENDYTYNPSTCPTPACENDPFLCPNMIICPPGECSRILCLQILFEIELN